MTLNGHVRIGFVSTRFAGTDGVSLETVKWANVLNGLGHECFFFAGESDWPADHSHVVAEAHFNHPDILALTADLFDDHVRAPETSRRVGAIKDHLKTHLYTFVQDFKPHLLVAENALCLPMHVPLGLALTEMIAETGIPVIAHHHDFAWERERFAINAAEDYLRAAFPPVLPSIHHVVINSFAAHQLAMRTGERSVLVPNVMDFDTPPPAPDEYTASLRDAIGVRPDTHLLLQPTRIVPRKRIERAIELARRLNLPVDLVISHSSGDEGDAYARYLRELADLLDVRVIFAADRMGMLRGQTPEGQPIYSLGDAYYEADLVTYPSAVEGFGNAFLETIYFRRPIIMCNYEIFNVDIRPKGFRVITFGDFIPDETVRETRALLEDGAGVEEMVEENYRIAQRYYSFTALEKYLVALLSECLGA